MNTMTPKTLLLIALSVLCGISNAKAEVTLKEIRSASNDVLVAFFAGDSVDINEIDIEEKSQWKINGIPAVNIYKYATQSNPSDHHIYLETSNLQEGKRKR